MNSPVTTHVLDTSNGRPAANLAIEFFRMEADNFQMIKSGVTNADGRLKDLITSSAFTPGIYKMKFHTEDYFKLSGTTCFYPYAEVVFKIRDTQQHYHIPLLLSPYSYSTYRGS